MQVLNRVSPWAKSKVTAVVTLATLGAGQAMAALPAEVSTELADLKTNALLVAGIVLAAIVAVYAFKFIRKGF